MVALTLLLSISVVPKMHPGLYKIWTETYLVLALKNIESRIYVESDNVLSARRVTPSVRKIKCANTNLRQTLVLLSTS